MLGGMETQFLRAPPAALEWWGSRVLAPLSHAVTLSMVAVGFLSLAGPSCQDVAVVKSSGGSSASLWLAESHCGHAGRGSAHR